MKSCPVCRLDLEDTYLFCPEDGSPLQPPHASILAKESHEDTPAQTAVEESNLKSTSHVVLYCPACAAEYPLTFSDCPVHGVPLTRHSIATFVNPPAAPALSTSEPRVPEPAEQARTPFNQEARNAAPLAAMSEPDHLEPAQTESETVQEPSVITGQAEDQVNSYERSQGALLRGGQEPKSFRIAAIMIIVGLAVLSLAGLYTLYSNVTRKPASPAARPADKPSASAPEPEFIPTPQAALDYKEEPVAAQRPEAAAAGDEAAHEKEPARAAAIAPARPVARQVEERSQPPASPQPAPVAPQAPAAVRRQASATDLVLPRGTYGLVDARLIRMRARQTPSGYRYDLTFNLQEQAGRVAQYDRLAVVTHSASGINHSEVMPFSHRLGAAGDLTFTISVELKGRSEPDWQGRIICTTSGTDNQGRPLRTSFGAHVSP
ncbi:MAG: hypothetical protein ACLGJB_17480 [Blastocatellia bacterium]